MTSPYIVLSGLGVAVIPCSGHVQRTSGQPGGSVSECRSLVVIAGVFCCTIMKCNQLMLITRPSCVKRDLSLKV